jgi:hypothetical protein
MRLIESGPTTAFCCPAVETFDQHRPDWMAELIFVVSLNLACACRILPSRMRNRPGCVRRDTYSEALGRTGHGCPVREEIAAARHSDVVLQVKSEQRREDLFSSSLHIPWIMN